MKDRQEFKEDFSEMRKISPLATTASVVISLEMMTEVLLDIRDLLSKP